MIRDRDHRIQLTLEPLPDTLTGPDRWQRLRLILKKLLRQHRWRCVEVRPIEHESGDVAGDEI